MNMAYIKRKLVKKKGDKMEVDVKREDDIFKLLNLKYKSPEERIDGRSIELINKETTKKSEEKKEEKPKRKYTRKKK